MILDEKRFLILVLKQLGIIMLMYTLCRILFLVFNLSDFSGSSFIDLVIAFIHGLRFDFSAIIYSNSIYLFFFIIPIEWHQYNWYRITLRTYFYVVNGIAIMLNLIDLEYFTFAKKRTDSAIFMGNNDIFALLPTYIISYGYILLLLAALLYLIHYLFKRYDLYQVPEKIAIKSLKKTIIQRIILTILIVVITIIGARGGFQIKPIRKITASYYGDVTNASLVLNTPFTIMQSLGQQHLSRVEYFTDKQAQKQFPIFQRMNRKEPFSGQNVVIIILESFSKELIGSLNNEEGFTPFLDSLSKESLVFENAFANGSKSIEALPSILAGIPSLMDEAYVNSAYQNNKITSLPSLLRKRGYATSMFHGGVNGTMSFDAFARQAGIKKYYGMNEYPDKEDYDGDWGIYDGPYLQYVAKTLNTIPQPFFSTIFTLSSHHPYTLPEKYKARWEEKGDDFQRSVLYADESLRNFFKKASKMRWFKNTLFVFVADHTGPLEKKSYNNPIGYYRIPIIFYKQGSTLRGKSKRIIQQIDILPSVLDYLHYPGRFKAIGRSVFDKSSQGFAVNNFNNLYQLIDKDFLLQYDGSKVKAFYKYKEDTLLDNSLHLDTPNKALNKRERLLKSLIQVYTNALIDDKLK